MVIGLTIAACLLCTGDSKPAIDYMPVNSRRLTIPLCVLPELRAGIREFHVYVSKDLGKHWEMLPAIPMPKNDEEVPNLVYEAKEDGMILLRTSTVDKTTYKEDPPRPSQGSCGKRFWSIRLAR